MPMEESANMLLMLAGIIQRLGTPDFLQPYWNLMETWAQYLNSTLPDPENQLCTDDFVCNYLEFLQTKKTTKLTTFSWFRKDHHHIIVI